MDYYFPAVKQLMDDFSSFKMDIQSQIKLIPIKQEKSMLENMASHKPIRQDDETKDELRNLSFMTNTLKQEVNLQKAIFD